MNRRFLAAWVLSITGATVTTGCASFEEPLSCEASAARVDAYISVSQLAEWDAIDSGSLLLWAPNDSRAYLVTLARPVPELAVADDIDVIDGDLDGSICGCGRDFIFVAGMSARVPIDGVEYLTERRSAELAEGLQGTIRTSLGVW